MLIGEHIYLRILQSSDIADMLKWENNQDNWEVSGTKEPYTLSEIESFVNSVHDIHLNLQIRYVICLNQTNRAIGTIDLFELNPEDKKVGVGVLIGELVYRNKGYASEALRLIIDYCRNELKIVHVFCNINQDNLGSIRLFEKCGFLFMKEKMLFGNKVNYYELML